MNNISMIVNNGGDAITSNSYRSTNNGFKDRPQKCQIPSRLQSSGLFEYQLQIVSTFADVNDIDTSARMEEIREELFQLLQSEFSHGVLHTHLKATFEQRHPHLTLPADWLQQLTDEFDVQRHAHLITVYAKLPTTSPKKNPIKLLPDGKNQSLTSQRNECESMKSTGVKQTHMTAVQLAQQLTTISIETINESNQWHDVIISSGIDPTDFYIHLLQNEPSYQTMLDGMASSYSSPFLNQLTSVDAIDIGGVYAVECASAIWQRAVVCERISDRYRVRLIDVGYCDLLSVDRFRRLLPDFVFPVECAQFAIHVSLDINTADGIDQQVFAACIAHDDDADRPQKFRIRFIDNRRSSSSDTYRIELRTTDDVDVLQLIRRPQFRTIREHHSPPSSISSSVASCVDLQPMKSSTNQSARKLIPLDRVALPPANGEPFKVDILYALDPYELRCRLASQDPLPSYLSDLITRESIRQPMLKHTEPIVVGEFYAALISEDNDATSSWHRVLICDTSMHAGHFKAFLVDVGHFTIVHRDKIRPLTTAGFAVSYMCAIVLKIADVAPADGGKQWSPDAVSALRRKLTSAGTRFVARQAVVCDWVIWRSKSTSGTNPTLPMTTVHLSTESTNEDIGEWLIDNKFAVRIGRQ